MFMGYFMDDQCIKGNYYFKNGDMFQGVLVNNQFVKGKYVAYNKIYEYNGQFENGKFSDSKGRIIW